MSLEPFKRAIRLLEANLTPLTRTIRFSNHKFHLLRSIWWNEADQAWFDLEIAPYFRLLEAGNSYRRIVDAGGSSGAFAIAAAAVFPGAMIEVFEPSPRNQIIISRNASKNAVADRVRVHPVGLWNEPARLAFRTHGAISSLQKATMLDRSFAFDETVEVVMLDEWVEREGIDSLDLIKMDIEGAEIEALQGAAKTLQRFHPEILLQAYHLRDGTRTLERCLHQLEALGYRSRKVAGFDGFVHAKIS